MTMLHTYLQKLLKMMFQKLKYLFLKTWLLTKVFKRRWNITNSKLQTTPGFEGIKQLERLKTWSPALTMICGMLKENPSQCDDFKSNESTGSTTVNTMLNYWQVNFWHLIYWTALHFRILCYWQNTLRGLATMIQLRELITCILQFTYIFPRETVLAIIRCNGRW